MKFSRRQFLYLVAGRAALSAMSEIALALDYPTRPVTIIVPFPPGGAGDILARTLGGVLGQNWREPVVVENKPGAGGIIGANAAARAVADGYTLLVAPSATIAVNGTLYKSLSYDPSADFMPLALLAQTPFVLVVNPDLPVDSLADLIAYAKAKGPLLYATAGPGLPHHLFAELFKGMTGIDMTPVAYRGSLAALNDVVAGHVPLMFVDVAPALGMVRAGKVRALGVSTKVRVPAISDVPAINEAGVPGFDAASWQMMVAPAKTPPAIVEKLHHDLATALVLSEVRERIAGEGMLLVDDRSLSELQDFVAAEINRWSKVVREAGLAGSQ